MKKTNFGKILQDRRKRLGMKQEELASKIGVNYTYLSKLESENSNPNYTRIKKLCDGLGLTIEQFFSGVEETGGKPTILEVYKNRKSKEEIKEHRVKAKLIPIRVVKGLDALSIDRDIEKEFTANYIYIEEDMFEKPQNIIGLEVDKIFLFSSMRYSKTIFLVDTKKSDAENLGYYITHFPDSNEVGIMRTEIQEDQIVFFDATTRRSPPLFPEAYMIYNKSKIKPGTIRGKVVGVFGKF